MTKKIYRKEGSSLYNCNYIVSFCTKYKRRVLNESMRNSLKEIFDKISKTYDFNLNKISISENQVTLEIECSPTLGIKTAITKLKNGSATEMKELYPELNSRIPSIWTRDSYIVTTGEFKPTDIDEFLKLQKKYESYNIEE